MKAIALIGPKGSGKSTLAFSLSKFLEKKGLAVGIASLGGSQKGLKYKPFWNETKKTDLLKAGKQMEFDAIIIDSGETLEKAFFENSVVSKADVVFLVVPPSDAPDDTIEALASVFEERLGTKVFAVQNSKEVSKKRGLFSSKVIQVSAWEKMGFEKLYGKIY